MNNTSSGKFPEALLIASAEKRMRYFADCLVHHRNLDETVNTVMRYIESPESENLIVVCGPSGVGKKEFIREITSKLGQAEDYSTINIGNIPVVNVEARAPEEGSFKFSSLWMDALKIMNEPMLNQKISYRDVEKEGENGQKTIVSRIIKADYQYILHSAFGHRHVKAFIINEAQHMCRVATDKKANWSLDVIKSLANESETAVVLVGTYDLLNIINASANFVDQIHQRAHIIDFARYHEYDPEEVQYFGKTAKKLINNMPFKEIDDRFADKNWRYLYMYSLGRIGTLKRWFLRAYSYAIEQQAKSLTKDHLDKTRNSGNQIKFELKAIEDGEAIMANIRSDGDIRSSFKFYDRIDNKEQQKAPASRRSKPFERKPARDVANDGLENAIAKGGESVS